MAEAAVTQTVPEITEADLEVPLHRLARDDRRRVQIRDMEDCWDLLFAVESVVLEFWGAAPGLEDREVVDAFKDLLARFDGQEEGTLAYWIGRSVKQTLVLRRRAGQPDYTVGEVLSCVSLLKNVAKRHRSPNRRGYLLWVKAFFEGRMPRAKAEILEWIARNET